MLKKVYALICTRNNDLGGVTKKLVSYLSRCSIDIKLLVDQKSIFSAYKKGFDHINPNDEDIIIMCHDDIEILNSEKEFISLLLKELKDENTGFIGPAGTKYLGKDSIWWNHERWKAGYHSGAVFHTKEDGKPYPTEYGPLSKVTALDGLFLAVTAKNLRKITLDKPNYFSGAWDFYDIYYTTTMHKIGLNNRTFPVKIQHQSNGDLVGRDSWHSNRVAFSLENDKDFPIYV